MKEDFVSLFREFSKETDLGVDSGDLKKIENKFQKFLDKMKKKVTDFVEVLEDLGGFEGFFKEAWNCQELKSEKFTFLECIQWVKKYIKKEVHSGACLLLLDEKSIIDKNDKHKYKLHLCLLDKDDNPLLDGNTPHIYIYTNELDADLLGQFKNNTMLILK